VFLRLLATNFMAISLACCSSTERVDEIFDFTHVELSLIYLENPTESNLENVSKTEGMRHLKNHSDRTGYYSNNATPRDIAQDLLRPDDASKELLSEVKQLLDYARSSKTKQSLCISEAKNYLPRDFQFEGNLFFTWGYDIGVSMDKNASLNLTHRKFREDKEEIWFYCIHEMHHVGIQHFHKFPALSEVKTGDQLLSLVKYLSFLEGTAVYASYDARRMYDALDDSDYQALENPELMQEYTRDYFERLEEIRQIGSRSLTDEDWSLLDELSDGKRLWYRVGAEMARQIDAAEGRETLISIIETGPNEFFDTYLGLKPSPVQFSP